MVIENLFLILLGLIWIIFGVIQDLKKREIANWLNFSLVIFALGFRFFYSLFSESGFDSFYQGIIGFGIFFIIGNLFYYGKVFAGGDAKLMIALGTIIPLSLSFSENINFMLKFLLFFLISGAVYGVIFGISLALKNKSKFSHEFSRQFKLNKKVFYFFLILGIIALLFSFKDILFLYLGILFFFSPYVYFFAKSIDESCMVKKINTKKLSEGDWLYENIHIGKRVIEAKWSGLNSSEILFLIKNKKFVLIREGIPFSPVFLLAYLILLFSLIF